MDAKLCSFAMSFVVQIHPQWCLALLMDPYLARRMAWLLQVLGARCAASWPPMTSLEAWSDAFSGDLLHK
jgi:hypothetical protein